MLTFPFVFIFKGQLIHPASGIYDEIKKAYIMNTPNVTVSVKEELQNGTERLKRKLPGKTHRNINDSWLIPNIINFNEKLVKFSMLRADQAFYSSCQQVVSYNGEYRFEVKKCNGDEIEEDLIFDSECKY